MISGNIHEKSNLAVLPEPLQRAVQFLKTWLPMNLASLSWTATR